MSNARNLANLLGTGTTINTSDIADDAITNAKILNDAVTGAKIEDNPTIAGNLTIAGNATAQGTTSGFVDDDKFLLDATDGSATDAGDNLVLNGTDGTSANADSSVLFEEGTNDGSAVLTTEALSGEMDNSSTIKSEGGAVTTNIAQGLAKAFCTTDGDTTINDSFNISSATDDGSGDNSFVVTNHMGNSTFCVSGLAKSDDNDGRRMAAMMFAANATSMASHFARVHCNYDNTNAREPEYICVVFHGDLA